MPEQLNQTSVVVTTLIHYNVMVRDTLEYCLNKPTSDVALFKNKKRAVLIEVDENTPLKNIIKNSTENEAGAKFEKLVREFYAEVYADDSRILSLGVDPEGKEELRVDHSQSLTIYKYVLPIHQNVSSMISGILNDAHSKNIDVAEVEKVYLNFRKPDQKDLDHMSVEEARKYIEEGHFAPGSMLPKVKAAVDFAISGPGRKAIITSLYKAVDALQGKTGTVIEA